MSNLSRSDSAKLLQATLDIDHALWNKYHPDDKGEEYDNQLAAIILLEEDIAFILRDADDVDETAKEIENFIKTQPLGNKVLEKHKTLISSAKEDATVRRDFAAALRSVKRGRNLSSALGWGFSDRDISELAKLHKKNKFRKKIEDLLEDCNFHAECGDFSKGRYDEYIKEPV